MDGDAGAARFIDAEGVRVHVAQRGAGEDVLLIHGASSDMGVFEPTVVPLLQSRFRVTAYDRPGMGFTAARPPHAETLGVQAKVAAGVIDRLGLNRPIVIGHSYGGSVALRLALDHPGKVGGLVLIAAVAYDWPGGVSWHLHWSSNPVIGTLFNQLLTRPFIDTAMRSGTLNAFAPSALPADYLVRAGVMRAARPSAMRANSHDVTALKREIIAQQARYSAIKIPVAILAGDGDTVVSSMIHSVKLAQILPNARIDVLQGVGHLPHEASPERFAKLVDWVQSEK
jgi:pimeloyl-ACP methyl ester carboxylesterase